MNTNDELVINIDKLGKELYDSNENYKQLVNLMEQPEFRRFYNQNFEDVDSVKTFIMFMKIYEGVEKYSEVELTPYEKIAIVDKIIHDSKKRKEICKGIQEWFKQVDYIKLSKIPIDVP